MPGSLTCDFILGMLTKKLDKIVSTPRVCASTISGVHSKIFRIRLFRQVEQVWTFADRAMLVKPIYHAILARQFIAQQSHYQITSQHIVENSVVGDRLLLTSELQ